MIHVTLFHGTSGWAIGLLSLIGAVSLMWQAERWLERLNRRAPRRGALVGLLDGSTGVVLFTVSDPAVAGTMAAVRLAGEHDSPSEAVWVSADRLRPLEYEKAVA
jgi:hypothetical protein